MRTLTDLDEKEILALAISSEEDGRIYADFADMALEKSEHQRMLIDTHVEKFGTHIPLVRRQAVRSMARQMEVDASRFHTDAASRSSDASMRKLLGDLAAGTLIGSS